MLTALMNQAVTVVSRGPGVTTDVYGDVGATTTASTETVGYLEQTAETEVIVDRQTYTSEHLLYLPPLTAIDGSDRVVVDGVTFEVLGPPARRYNPRLRVESHVECRLKVVT